MCVLLLYILLSKALMWHWCYCGFTRSLTHMHPPKKKQLWHPAHPVQHVRPALHGDALKHSQHGKQKVVKVGNAPVGTLPAFPALCAVDGALAPMPWDRTWSWFLFCYCIYRKRKGVKLICNCCMSLKEECSASHLASSEPVLTAEAVRHERQLW